MASKARPRRLWTEEEDAVLRREAEFQLSQGSLRDWNRMASKLPGRTNKDCRKRWSKVSEHIKKGAWSEGEDHLLRAAVGKFGYRWTQVAQFVGTRHADQCAKRWQHSLDPALDHSKWVPEDDDRLLKAVSIYGRNWKVIGEKIFPFRSTTDLKNRHVILERRQLSASRTSSTPRARPGPCQKKRPPPAPSNSGESMASRSGSTISSYSSGINTPVTASCLTPASLNSFIDDSLVDLDDLEFSSSAPRFSSPADGDATTFSYGNQACPTSTVMSAHHQRFHRHNLPSSTAGLSAPLALADGFFTPSRLPTPFSTVDCGANTAVNIASVIPGLATTGQQVFDDSQNPEFSISTPGSIDMSVSAAPTSPDACSLVSSLSMQPLPLPSSTLELDLDLDEPMANTIEDDDDDDDNDGNIGETEGQPAAVVVDSRITDQDMATLILEDVQPEAVSEIMTVLFRSKARVRMRLFNQE